MSFSGLILTNAGRNELIKAEMGTPFRITAVAFGDGSYNGSYMAIKSLAHKVMELPVTRIERKGDEVWVECDFVSTDVPQAFYMREIGIIANGQLCYYDNAREDAEYIDPDAGNLIKQKRMRFVLLISGEVEIHTEIASSLYALETDLRECEDALSAAIATKAPADKAFLNRGIFAGDIDSLRGLGKAGSYWVQPVSKGTTSATDSFPFGSECYYDLCVFVKNTTDATQMAICYEVNGRNDVRYRMYTNGQWYPWSTRTGTGNISGIGDGSMTGAIAALNAPTFTQAGSRINIVSGDKIPTIFGKIMKFFADLKAVAFSGSYSDLSDKPSIPAAVAVKGNAEAVYRTGNVNLTPANIGLGNVANERQYSASNPQPSVTGSSGSCTGNAATATKAAQDGNGRNIAATYLPKSDIGGNYGASLTVTKSIPNDAETEILSVTIGVAGVYLIHGQANFASNKNGLRRLELKNNNADGSFGGTQVGASGSGKTDVQVVGISASTFAAGGKVRLYAQQNCGAALNVTSAYMCAIRLK